MNKLKKIPWYFWLITILCFLAPFLIEDLLENGRQIIWSLHIISVIIFSYYGGIVGGLFTLFISSFSHLIWNYMENYSLDFSSGEQFEWLLLSFNGLIITISIGLLADSLGKKRQEIEDVFNNGHLAFWVFNFKTRQVRISKGISHALGREVYEQREGDLLDWEKYIHPDDWKKLLIIEEKGKQGEIIHPFSMEYRIIREDGKIVWLDAYFTPIMKRGKPYSLNVVTTDTTERKEFQEKISQMAYHDALTGLPNRYYFDEQLEKVLHSARKKKEKVAVFQIDFDNFKLVNDKFGHPTGDELLKQIAKRFRTVFPDEAVIARLAGDEFTIFIPACDRERSTKISSQLLHSFRESFIVDNQEIFISPSIGIATYPIAGESVETLVKNADSAMYSAKEKGKNNFQFYSLSIQHSIDRRIFIENGLRMAIENNHLSVYYQPKIDLFSGDIIGFEALTRWKFGSYGFISPSEFIPIAEDTGLINALGEWVMREACRQNKEWQDEGLFNVPISVNVSAKQFKKQDLFSDVKKILDDLELDPQYLEIEITESTMQDFTESSQLVKTAKEHNLKIAIDDFGTGYSSLNVLKNLSIDVLKIDKSFVNDMLTNTHTANLTKTIINMAKNLDYKVVAEGIETREQLDILQELGCDYGQGYYWSPPVPAEDIIKRFKVEV